MSIRGPSSKDAVLEVFYLNVLLQVHGLLYKYRSNTQKEKNCFSSIKESMKKR